LLFVFALWLIGATAGVLGLRLLLDGLRWLDRGFGATEVIVLDVLHLAFPVAFALLLAERARHLSLAHRLPRWLLVLSAWFLGALAGSLALQLLTATLRWLDQPFGTPALVADALLVAVATASAFTLSSFVQAHPLPHTIPNVPLRAIRRATLAAVLGLYFLTWAYGVPAVSTQLFRSSIDTYRHSHLLSDPYYREHYPFVKHSFGVPLLPGIVLVYYESQLGGQSGAGGWHVFAWWGSGQKRLAYYCRWVS
jgi:hypothetical protein